MISVRHLPCNLPEPVFADSLPPDTDVLHYIPGKKYSSPFKPNRPTLAVVQASDPVAFFKRYNSHVFVSADGEKTRVVLEPAQYKSVRTGPAKTDPRNATIQDDVGFIQFQELLENGDSILPDVPEDKAEKAADTSALLVHLRKKKLQQQQQGKKGRKGKKTKPEVIQKQPQQSPASTTTKPKRKRNRNRKKKDNTNKDEIPSQKLPQPSSAKPSFGDNTSGSSSRPRVVLVKKDGSQDSFDL